MVCVVIVWLNISQTDIKEGYSRIVGLVPLSSYVEINSVLNEILSESSYSYNGNNFADSSLIKAKYSCTKTPILFQKPKIDRDMKNIFEYLEMAQHCDSIVFIVNVDFFQDLLIDQVLLLFIEIHRSSYC